MSVYSDYNHENKRFIAFIIFWWLEYSRLNDYSL